ncbi:MAG: class I SAM-dependent methyltransferase, partial [Nitrospinales bacterium]
MQPQSPANIKSVYAKGYAKDQALNPSSRLIKVKAVLKTAGSFRPRRFLDAGCGDGTFTLELGKVLGVEEMYGFDISPEAVQLAQKKGIRAENFDIDLQDLPFEGQWIDMIYCGNLIELILNPDHLLREFHRVLTENGRLVITFPNLCSWASRLAVLWGYQPFYDRVSTEYDLGKIFLPIKKGKSTGFIRLFSLRTFKNLMQLHGFHVEKVWGCPEDSIPGPLKIIDF